MDRISNNLLALLLVFAMMISALGTTIALTKIESFRYQSTGKVAGIVGVCISNAPILSPIGDINITQNEDYFFDANDTQTTHDTEVVLFWDNTSFFVINQTSGTINFTATNAMVGEHWVLVWVNESACGMYNSEAINMTVYNVNDAPVLDFISDQILYEDQSYYFDVNASDPDLLTPYGDTVRFGDNTSFFIIDPITGEISFTPIQSETGNHSILIYVFDLEYLDTQAVNFEIIEVNDAPVLDNIGAQTATANSLFHYDVNGTDEENDTLTFYDNSSIFNIDPISGEINFTPNSSEVNNYSINISVTDGEKWDWEVISFTVVGTNNPPVITSWHPSQENTTSATEADNETTEIWYYTDTRIIFRVLASDPDGTKPSYWWELDGSVLPGEIYNNYTYTAPQSGTFVFEVYATDGQLNDTHKWNVNILKRPKDVPVSGGGGGSIFGPSIPSCDENWRCTEWSTCSKGGIQFRTCVDVAKCGTFDSKPSGNQTCIYTPLPNCTDGIKNCHDGQCEIMTDCGGPCDPCPTCDDGIKNQGELGIDCGGPCPQCSAKCIIATTYAVNTKTGECRSFSSPCDIPEQWKVVDQCPPIQPVYILLYIIVLAFIITALALIWFQRRQVKERLRKVMLRLRIKRLHKKQLTREEKLAKEALEKLNKIKALSSDEAARKRALEKKKEREGRENDQ